ncbi:sensor histidine kinase [Bacillus daqingensis]|uniref:Sensor histidine kinase n=1 Tax=Bacillus daqingensis TaxID=872396 RepID=A0ABV9P087_9BACI
MLSTVQKQVVQQLQLAHSKKGLMAVFQAYIDATFPAGEPVLTAPLHQSAPLHSDAYFYRTALDDHPSGKPAVVQVKDRTGDDTRFQIIPLYEPDGTRWEVLTRSTSWYPVVRWKQYQLQQMADVFFLRMQAVEDRERAVKKAEDAALIRASQAVHDTISQKLFFLSALLFQLKLQEQPDTATMEKRLQELQKEARDLIADLRGDKERLDPALLLKQTLETICADQQLMPVFSAEGTAVRERPEIKEAVFYIGEELMANAAKHSGAGTLHVTVTVNPVQWELVVRDDGRGIRNRDGAGYGLTGIRQRLEKLGGTLKLEHHDGTAAFVTIPRRGGTWHVQTAFSG